MRIISILIFVFIACAGVAQTVPTFNKIFGDTTLLYGGLSIINYGDTIYFSMYEQNLPMTYQATTLIKTDPAGNPSVLNRFYQPQFLYYGGQIKITSDGYLICGGSSGSLNNQGGRATFFKFDRISLDSIFIRYYDHGNISILYGCNELSTGGYIFAGEASDTSIHGSATAWVLRTDTAGNQLWQKNLKSDVSSVAYSPNSFTGGYYQPWGTGHPNTASGNPADSAIFVDKYDNNGHLIWRDTLGIIGHDNAQGPFVGLKGGGGIVLVNILDTTGFQDGPTVIYKFDTSGVIVWTRYISLQTQQSSMTETKSGDIVACGWGGGIPIGIPHDTKRRLGGDILKLDKDGNIIFYQVYEYDTTSRDVLADITETADGGYACVGNAYAAIGNLYYQRAWLLKVDSNGCLNGDCPQIQTGIADIPNMVSFFVFPNPASSQFTVALAGPNDLARYSDLHFTLYDLTDREVMEESLKQQTTTVQRNDIADGMYVWTLTDSGRQIQTGKIVFR